MAHFLLQEAWKISTAAGSRRVRKGGSVQEVSASNTNPTKESEMFSKLGFSLGGQGSVNAESAQVSLLSLSVCGSWGHHSFLVIIDKEEVEILGCFFSFGEMERLGRIK